MGGGVGVGVAALTALLAPDAAGVMDPGEEIGSLPGVEAGTKEGFDTESETFALGDSIAIGESEGDRACPCDCTCGCSSICALAWTSTWA